MVTLFQKKITRENLPHLVHWGGRRISDQWYAFWTRLSVRWWGINMGVRCSFSGHPKFRRHPMSTISIGPGCRFLSLPASNLIGVNRPCILSTLQASANLVVGKNCGFSGTVIGCAKEIILGDDVRCGANTLITDTDWHSDDWRAGPDLSVRIGNNVWLGANVTVMKGVSIGDNSMVGTYSLVTHSIPSNVIAAGIPAKIIKPLPLMPKQNHINDVERFL